MDMQKVAELRKKANTLPMEPGVYLMRDRRGEIIYVGKAKKLKNRVTSYFRGWSGTCRRSTVWWKWYRILIIL